MAGLITNDKVVYIDRRRGLEIQTFMTQEELAKYLIHLADYESLDELQNEIILARQELDNDERIARSDG